MRRLVSFLALAAVLATACSSTDDGASPRGGDDPPEVDLRLEATANLESFDDCDGLLDYFRETAREMGEAAVPHAVGRGGVALDAPAVADRATGGATGGDGAATSESATAPVGEAGSGVAPLSGERDFSATNIQEAGVDEPDVVKTDGNLLVAIAGGRLQVVDPAGTSTRVSSSVELPSGDHELFLHDDRAVVLTRSWRDLPVEAPTGSRDGDTDGDSDGDADADDPVSVEPHATATSASTSVMVPGTSTTTVSAVDLADPSAPAVVDSTTVEGETVSARLHEGVVRLVLRSAPTLRPTAADDGADPIEGSTLEAWLPDRLIATDLETGAEAGAEAGGEVEGAEAREEPLVACDAVTRPPEPSGVGTVTVLAIDAGGSMEPVDTDTVVADAQTVYASTETLYVATNHWTSPDDADPAGTSTTAIHAFDVSDPRTTEYLASGRVRGQMLDQWSLSEHDGFLRVATTDGSPWAGTNDRAAESESFLTVLRRDGERLEAVGQVGGLGRGERIFAVRYFGDVGFVVTFREIDPLYALDLSDPADPTVTGELKITGFSSYLHPVGEGRLLGVGQEATTEGQTLGTQLSLFDISDRSDLERIASSMIEGASSPVEHDHRAFLWWEPERLAVLPVEVWGRPAPAPTVDDPAAERAASRAPSEPFSGVAAFVVSGDDVEPVGRVSHAGKVPSPERPGVAPLDDGPGDRVAVEPHPGVAPSIRRALVVGDSLYTVSHAGVMASDLDTLDEQAWAAF